ncbi:MAG: hypothetical protein AABZ07_06805, partial [Nitrospirota bacterium]
MYPFYNIIEKLTYGEYTSKISGLWGSSKAMFLTGLFEKSGQSIFVITPDSETADTLLTDLRFFSRLFASHPAIFSFPYWEILPYDTIPPHTEITHARMSVYRALLSGTQGIFVIPANSIIQRVITPVILKRVVKKLHTGMEIEKDALAAHLVDIGYEPSDLVISRGTFSLRGGIVDIFSPGEDSPARIEFFGDTIESLRSFDPETQRSVSQIDSVVIMPAKEPPHLVIPAGCGDTGSLFEFISYDDIVVFDEPVVIKTHITEYWSQIWDTYKDVLLQGRRVLEPEKLYMSWEEITETRCLFNRNLDIESLPIEGTTSVSINSTSSLLADIIQKGSPLKEIAERLDVYRKDN